MNTATSEIELSIVLPCLDESETVGICVSKAVEVCRQNGIEAEIVVADNGSKDGSQELARKAGARVLHVPIRGYGAALQAGIESARGTYVIMADSDDSYEFADIPKFLSELRKGAELVMGSRFRGKIHPGAMPFLHRYLGNPVLTGILNLFFKAGISDAHCGMRGFSREAVRKLNLKTHGMEFASEMIIRSCQEGLRITDIPTSLKPAGRSRKPHLRTWRDGWRHLRFMLMFSPMWLFLVPGAVATFVGLFLMVSVAFVPLTILGHRLNTHFALLGSLLSVIGLQVIALAVFAKTVLVLEGLGRSPKMKRFVETLNLEFALICGTVLFLIGFGIDGWILAGWIHSGGGPLNENHTHLVIAGSTLCVLGVQVIFSAFFLSILKASRTEHWV